MRLTFCDKLVPGPDLEVLYLSPFVDKHSEEVASISRKSVGLINFSCNQNNKNSNNISQL
jgi:hypothetical protein